MKDLVYVCATQTQLWDAGITMAGPVAYDYSTNSLTYFNTVDGALEWTITEVSDEAFIGLKNAGLNPICFTVSEIASYKKTEHGKRLVFRDSVRTRFMNKSVTNELYKKLGVAKLKESLA